MRGNERVSLDLTFPKMVIANTMKLSCFYDEGRKEGRKEAIVQRVQRFRSISVW